MTGFLRGLYIVGYLVVFGALWPVVGLVTVGREWESSDRDADPFGALMAWVVGCLLVVPAWVKLAALLG
jgi:hypothetical protein